MANTYTQLYIQIVFAVEGRNNLIPAQHKEELHKIITGIVQERGSKLIAVNSMPDHVHVLIGLDPTWSLSDLVRDIKAVSSRYANDKRWLRGKFNWQQGFGAFSYSRSQLPAVIHYIQNQEQHHRKKTFRDEYLKLLERFEIEFDHKYIFKFYDDIEVASGPPQ